LSWKVQGFSRLKWLGEISFLEKARLWNSVYKSSSSCRHLCGCLLPPPPGAPYEPGLHFTFIYQCLSLKWSDGGGVDAVFDDPTKN